MPTRSVALALGVFGICIGPAPAAPPAIEYIDPAGARRGSETAIKISGTWGDWPPQVWADRPVLEIAAAEEKDQLKVRVAADAAPGVYWFRLHNGEGATPMIPLIVGTLPEVQEQEPNESAGEAQSLDEPCTANGRLQQRGDVDVYKVRAEAGQTLVAAVDANRTLRSPMDAVLQITTSDGFVLAQNDDARGLDPLLVFEVPATADYLIRVFAFPERPNTSVAFAGGPNFVYRLTVTIGGFLDYALPMAARSGEPVAARAGGWCLPADQMPLNFQERSDGAAVLFHPELAGSLEVPLLAESFALLTSSQASASSPLTLPVSITGCFTQPGQHDVYTLEAKKGQKLSIVAEAEALGYELDPVIQFRNAAGELIKEVDDLSKSRDAELVQAIAADGQYRIEIGDVHGLAGPRHVYRLTIEEAVPDFSLSLAAGEHGVKPGESVAIPIAVSRQNGFAEEIEVTAIELPEGISAEPVVSSNKGESAKSVKLMLTASQTAHSGNLLIVGQAAESPFRRTARFSVPGSRAGHRAVWLTVTPSK